MLSDFSLGTDSCGLNGTAIFVAIRGSLRIQPTYNQKEEHENARHAIRQNLWSHGDKRTQQRQ